MGGKEFTVRFAGLVLIKHHQARLLNLT